MFQGHLVYLSLNYNRQFSSPEELLEKFYTIPHTVSEISKLGVRVSVVQRFYQDKVWEKNGVKYYFINDGKGPFLPVWKKSKKVLSLVSDLKPEFLHLHNMRQLRMNHAAARIAPTLLQNHGEPPFSYLNLLQTKYLKPINYFLFSAVGQECPWLEKKLISPQKVRFVMEGSSFILNKKGEQPDFNLEQNFIWTGNLDENKDPLTVLRALDSLFEILSSPSLIMVYRNNGLLEKVKQCIASSKNLKNKVKLLGSVSQKELVELYQKSHFFVQGSSKEGSGYSILEAMSVGVVPIITNIPSFLLITDQARLGAVFKVGNERSFLEETKKLLDKNWNQESKLVKEYFDENFTFTKIAEELINVYSEGVQNTETLK